MDVVSDAKKKQGNHGINFVALFDYQDLKF